MELYRHRLFTSPEPLVWRVAFTPNDTENGLDTEDRVGVRQFKVNSEAYTIEQSP